MSRALHILVEFVPNLKFQSSVNMVNLYDTIYIYRFCPGFVAKFTMVGLLKRKEPSKSTNLKPDELF